MATDEVKVKDTRLYDVLGVAPTATQHEISVAYRRKREQVRVRQRRRPLTNPLPSHNCTPCLSDLLSLKAEQCCCDRWSSDTVTC